MTIALQIAGYWLAASLLFAACWSIVRGVQKHSETKRRIAWLANLHAYEMERARHYHIVTEYRRIGAL